MIIHIATDLILRLSACQEVSTSDWDIIDFNLSYDQVILGLCWHWGLPNNYSLIEEGSQSVSHAKLINWATSLYRDK